MLPLLLRDLMVLLLLPLLMLQVEVVATTMWPVFAQLVTAEQLQQYATRLQPQSSLVPVLTRQEEEEEEEVQKRQQQLHRKGALQQKGPQRTG